MCRLILSTEKSLIFLGARFGSRIGCGWPHTQPDLRAAKCQFRGILGGELAPKHAERKDVVLRLEIATAEEAKIRKTVTAVFVLLGYVSLLLLTAIKNQHWQKVPCAVCSMPTKRNFCLSRALQCKAKQASSCYAPTETVTHGMDAGPFDVDTEQCI